MLRKALLIEDAKDYQAIVRATLADRFEVMIAENAEEALEAVSHSQFDLLLIDVGLPGKDGLSLCQELRTHERLQNTPILLVTGRGEVADVVMGFEAGADDYIQKPFRPEELRARIEARLKRTSSIAEASKASAAKAAPDQFTKSDLRFSVGLQRVVHLDGGAERELDLTPNEFRILYFLARNEGRTLSRGDILKEVWGEKLHVVDRTVDKHVCALRKKLGSAGRFVASVSGEGYRFDPGASDPATARGAMRVGS